MKTWLKGGIILSGIYISLFIILAILGLLGGAQFMIISVFLSFPGLIIVALSSSLLGISLLKPLANILIVLFSIIVYFLLGALVGLMVGKSRSKKGVKK